MVGFMPCQHYHSTCKNGLLTQKIFPKKIISVTAIALYLDRLTLSNAHYTPHSLRIGGHTFYSPNDMPEDFVSFLGRRSISRASQLYYRAHAKDNILRLKKFFLRLDRTSGILKTTLDT